MSRDRLQDLLDLNEVQRWNSRVRLLRRQTVAEHTFNVMAIASELVVRLDLAPNLADKHRALYWVLRWGLHHDGPESETGDINYLFKRHFRKSEIEDLEVTLCPWIKAEDQETPSWARSIVKIADKIEEYLFITKWCPEPDKWINGILAQIETHVRNTGAYGWRNIGYVVGSILSRPEFGKFLTNILESEVKSSGGDLNPSGPVDPVDKPITAS